MKILWPKRTVVFVLFASMVLYPIQNAKASEDDMERLKSYSGTAYQSFYNAAFGVVSDGELKGDEFYVWDQEKDIGRQMLRKEQPHLARIYDYMNKTNMKPPDAVSKIRLIIDL
jgi:hypothetical protein